MNPDGDDVGVKPENPEEMKEEGPFFHCDLYDTDIVRKIAEVFLPGLASACVDNTTGGLLKSPGSVAVDIRREMVDNLIQRSENFVAESVVLEGGPDAEVSDNPFDIISDFVDDFASSKRNFFSRVSGWLLSERREDRIDDFAQEMELNGFWLLSRREAVAQTLLKNVDFKNMFHCSMKFKSEEELEEHKSNCSFRTMTCVNEGCNASFSAAQMEQHDATCPFKILPCEQNCSESIMRREMDRHCITVCPMKLVKCPFYSVGCQSTVPQCTIEQHRSENLISHLVCVLQVSHKGAPEDILKERAEELEKLSSRVRLVGARDARSLTYVIKDVEAKIGPLKIPTKPSPPEEVPGVIENKEATGSPTKDGKSAKSPNKQDEDTINDDHVKSPSKKEDTVNEDQSKGEDSVNSPSKSISSPQKREMSEETAANINEKMESPKEKEEGRTPSGSEESGLESSTKIEEHSQEELGLAKDGLVKSPSKDEDAAAPTKKNEEETESESVGVVIEKHTS